MATFSLKCETFVKLAGVCDFFTADIHEDTKELINCVRLEHKNGVTYAVATNKKIAAIQMIGVTEEPDSSVHVKITPEIIAALKKEIQYDSKVTINCIPEISMSSLQTTFGYNSPDCCYWFEYSPLEDWREWVAPAAKASSGGAMYWDLFHVESLIKSSPTGRVVFPEYIDSMKPVLLKDISTDDWRGVFIPSDSAVAQQAYKPAWWK